MEHSPLLENLALMHRQPVGWFQRQLVHQAEAPGHQPQQISLFGTGLLLRAGELGMDRRGECSQHLPITAPVHRRLLGSLGSQATYQLHQFIEVQDCLPPLGLFHGLLAGPQHRIRQFHLQRQGRIARLAAGQQLLEELPTGSRFQGELLQHLQGQAHCRPGGRGLLGGSGGGLGSQGAEANQTIMDRGMLNELHGLGMMAP